MDPQSAIGILVDEVKEVVTLDIEAIDKSKYNAKEEKSAYLFGVGQHEGTLISILDIESVIVENL